ncbi:uncharacterized protein LOC117573151 isoform X2 [Drosophila albomicans]|uniref:Uncharacterized protein LOC117573151 isoform X2 n=1 Tax=Drosophila albomicans TaxID=7291 RepID=A0A9C6WGH2_DROAB|nr:uncharacterized protein LOC117573151 isoform X2 [Drosophila albomicans]
MDTKTRTVTNSAEKMNNILRSPVAIVKKRSGPLDCLLDELSLIDGIDGSTSMLPNNSDLININQKSNQTSSDKPAKSLAKPIAFSKSLSSRRRQHSKDKDKKRERWLLTRKTWRYMTDAGRKLFPDGAHNGALENMSEIEAQFQSVCASESRFILWRRKGSFPGATKQRLRILSRHRFNHASHLLHKEEKVNENIDKTIEILQYYLKINDSFKTTFLLGSKTVRPDQTTSPSSQRPLNNVSTNRFSSVSVGKAFESGEHSTEHYELFERLKELCQSAPLRNIQLNDNTITPAIVQDTVLLKKIYNILKKHQLHRILHSSEPMKPCLRRASSFSSMLNYSNTSYKNISRRNAQDILLINKETVPTKRQLKPPKTLELSHSVQQKYQPHTRRSGVNMNSSGTQTDFIQLSELKRIAEEYEIMFENNGSDDEPRDEKHRRNSSIDNDDVSQSVSDTIKRYLRMARKKSVHDAEGNRFRSVNYDRNLQNIRAKGEINPPGMDEENNKAIQTLDAWAIIALDFIHGNENSKRLENAHLAWAKDLNLRIQKKLEYDRICQEKEITSVRNTKENIKQSQAISAPTSPTNPIQIHHYKDKAGRAAGALLTSSSHFISNFWHTNNSSINDNLNEAYINQKNDTNMQKSKSLSNVGQYVSRKIWGSRSKGQNRHNESKHCEPQSQKWAPSLNYTWISDQGQVIKINDTALENLSQTEASILKNIAIEKIKELNIGKNIDIELKSNRTRVISKKRALTTSFFDIGKKDEQNRRDFLFGTSLENSLSRNRKQGDVVPGSKSLTSVFRSNTPNSRVGKLNSNVRSCENLPTNLLDYVSSSEQGSSSDNLPYIHKTPTISKSIQISRSQFDVRKSDFDLNGISFDESNEKKLNVPVFVLNCIKYLEDHGLQNVGLFRVSTSKKRVKQLREDFDKKWNMCIPDNTCPHDVATLLKEYLRDLPEPLLCNKLYTTFLETQRIRNRRLQLEGISHLIKLLPIAHRDTLHVILRFLGNVAAHCDDIFSADGTIEITGNKMDSYNLSTIFAPNILRNSLSKAPQFNEHENMSNAINVIRIMIDHYEEIFKVPRELLDVLYTNMLDTCPDNLHALMSNKARQIQNQDENTEPKCNIVNPEYLKQTHYESSTHLKCDERRQSTPILLDELNVFSASLQISRPDESIKESTSNLGGAALSAKTAELGKTSNKCNADNDVSRVSPSKSTKLYKRQHFISSSRHKN